MDLNKIWADDTERAISALANSGTKIVREVDDHLTMEFTVEEWLRMFNVAEGYVGCNPDWKPFSSAKVFVRFVRVHKEEKGA